MTKSLLESKILGSLYAGAAGDAIGAPAENKSPDQIKARYGWIEGIPEPWDGPTPLGKGDGRYTDDTHMIQLLGGMYVGAQDHLDVFRFAKGIVPLIADIPKYVAEYGREMMLIDRLFYPEKWLLMRLRLANADPRLGGVGNMVNCGAAMYAAPVGMVNAGDPDGAYREAIEIFAAHQYSCGLEAAGVMAAAVASALSPGATIDSVVGDVQRLAREGTKRAIDAVLTKAQTLSDWKAAIPELRAAMEPFDVAALNPMDRGNGTDDWGPSRMKSIEEVPVALGFLILTGGDLQTSIFGGANYGRDCDSIAGMAGSIAGALHGIESVPTDWISAIDDQNKCDMRLLARDLAALAITLAEREARAAEQKSTMFTQLAAQS